MSAGLLLGVGTYPRGTHLESDSLFDVGTVALASGNPSEAYRCFSTVVERDSSRWDAWVGKAKAAGWMSTLADYRWREMEACTKAAVGLCPAEKRPEVAHALASEAISVAIAIHNLALDHANKHGGIALPEQFGLGVLTKAKPMQQVIDTYHERVTEAILASANAVSLAELHGVPSANLVVRAFSMARNVFVNSVVTVEGAQSPWNTIPLTFPPDKVTLVNTLVDRMLPGARKADPAILDPRQEAAQAQQEANKAAGCFVATAALGTSDHPDLDTLRSYRDRILMTSMMGRAFVAFYYRVSPPLAAVIARSSTLRSLALRCIVRPALRKAHRASGPNK